MPGISSPPIEQWLVRTYRVAPVRLWGIRILLIGVIAGAWLLVNAMNPADGAEAAVLIPVLGTLIAFAVILLIVVEIHAYRARRCGTICISPAGLWVAVLGQRIPWENVAVLTEDWTPKAPLTVLRAFLMMYWGALFLIFAIGGQGLGYHGPSGPFLVAVIDRNRVVPWLRWMGWMRPLSQQQLSQLPGIDAEACRQAGLCCVPLPLGLRPFQLDKRELITLVNLRARCGKGAKVSPRAL